MAKAVIVLDRMPDGCSQCDLSSTENHICQFTGMPNKDPRFRGPDCPLKAVPESRFTLSGDFSFEDGFRAGWNLGLGTITED